MESVPGNRNSISEHKLLQLSDRPGESPKGKWRTHSATWRNTSGGLRCTSELSVLNSTIYFQSTAVLNKFKFKLWKIKHAKESHTGNIYSVIHFDTKLKANPSMFFSIILHPDFPLSVYCKISYWQHRAALQELSGQSWRFWQVRQRNLRVLASRERMKCCLAVWHLWASWGFWHWKQSVSPPSFFASSNRGNMEFVGTVEESRFPT